MSLSFESIIDDHDESTASCNHENMEDIETVLQEISRESHVVKEEVDLLDLVDATYDGDCSVNTGPSIDMSLPQGSNHNCDDDSSNGHEEQQKESVSPAPMISGQGESESDDIKLKEILRVWAKLLSTSQSSEQSAAPCGNILGGNLSGLFSPPTHDIDSLRCTVCQCLYSTKSALVNHMKVHTRVSRSEPPTRGKVLCLLCGRPVKNMALHIRNHLRLYSCYCGRTFHKEAKLKDHFRTHTGERPFQCPICKKCFAVKHNLSTHMKYHEERPYQCPVCFKRFITRSYLEKHKIKEHFQLFSYDAKAIIESLLAAQTTW